MRYRSTLDYPLGIAHLPDVPLGAAVGTLAVAVMGAG